MAHRPVKRPASARGLLEPDSPSRAASPLGSPSVARLKGVNQFGLARKARHGLENVPPGESPAGRRGNPLRKPPVRDSPESTESEPSRPLAETSSNSSRPSPSKRKLEFAKGSGAQSGQEEDRGVKVIIRVRPMSKAEQLIELEAGLLIDGESAILADGQQYTFDKVAGEQATQAQMFDIAGKTAVENCLAGFNSSIFAYGQTGSGKTHTMTGQMDGSEARGLTSRVFEHLFQQTQQVEAANADRQLKHICKCSFLEIYNEQITDLLELSSKHLQVREDKKNGIYVEGLQEEIIETVEDIHKLILKGTANRTVGATNMNAASSRSHSVLTCTILSRHKNVSDGTVNVRRSKLNLVDLAGSERQKLTGAQGDRLKEASKINSSLSVLGNVINVLADIAKSGKQRHVPYRDSRLTYLLQESLGGNAKTVMIANVSPASSCLGETVSTLKFAQRAKAIQNKAVINEETTNNVNVLKQQIRRLKDELLRMKTATPPRSPSLDTEPSTPNLQCALDDAMPPSEAVSPEVMELTAKITQLSQEALLHESFQAKDSHALLDEMTDRRHVACVVSKSPELKAFPASPEGFEVFADSPGKVLDHTDSDADASEDEHSDKENSEGFQITPGAEESQLAFLKKLNLSVDSDLPQCVNSPDSPVFGRDRRTKFRTPPSGERNLLLTPPFTPAQSLDLQNSSPPLVPSAAEVEEKLRAAAERLNDDIIDDVKRSEETIFNSSDESMTSLTQSGESAMISPPEVLSPSADEEKENAEPATPFTPGFGKQQRWGRKEVAPWCESDLSDAEASAVRCHKASPNTPDPKVAPQASEELGEPSPAASPSQEEAPKRNEGELRGLSPAVSPANEKTPKSDARDPASLQMVVRGDRTMQQPGSLANSVADLVDSDAQLRTVEGVLAGALRREQVAQEHSQQLEGELQAMKRIVREYEHDYECNKKLVDCREDKIARLEQLADGVMSESEFMLQERHAAQLERRAMQEKIDRHPEVTRFAMENMRLVEQLRRYENFYGGGEREAVQKEVQQLREYVLHAFDGERAPATEPSARFETSDLRENHPGPSNALVASLQADVAYYKELAEVQRKEAEEAKHTLGGAILSNAKMASFFEDVQKENDRLLQKHRAVREATAHLVTDAVHKYGADPDSLWLQAHAAELAALRADDKENLQEIEKLQGQLRDAKEAVRTAGEVTTRLYNAEERVQACEEVAARAERTVKELRRKAEQARRQHAAELAAAEHKVREARARKGSVCHMCHMSDRVVFHIPDIEGTEEGKRSHKVLHRSRTEPYRVTLSRANKKGFWFWGKGRSKSDRFVESAAETSDSSPARKGSRDPSPMIPEGTADAETEKDAAGSASLESLLLSP